ncbi:hypothetical protein [Thermomonospora umbrina]|uniref:hypothetical protein n=1 Tax=Thermomonospora umbrina TaxID=111806 RepID=UPI001476D81E|nr:hypothetical protein [Thermomonospora umbrina]
MLYAFIEWLAIATGCRIEYTPISNGNIMIAPEAIDSSKCSEEGGIEIGDPSWRDLSRVAACRQGRRGGPAGWPGMGDRLAAEPNGDDVRHGAWPAHLVGADRSAISRALKAAAEAGGPLPPFTIDPATGRRMFPTTEFLARWDARPGRGRPRTRRPSRARRTSAGASRRASPSVLPAPSTPADASTLGIGSGSPAATSPRL